jgi:VanZ family protein
VPNPERSSAAMKRAHVALILYTLCVVLVSVIPGAPEQDVGRHLDKVGHFLAYAGLIVLGWHVFYSRRHQLMAVAGAVLLGIALEFVQFFVPHRSCSVYDGLANVLGAGIGLAIALLWEDHLRKLLFVDLRRK